MSSLTRISLTLVLALSFWGLRGVVLAQSESVGSTSNETTFAPIFSNAEGRAPFQPGLMRVDVSLSSSTPTSWDGEFRLSRGEFADLVPLGSNATSPTEFLFSDSTQSRLTAVTCYSFSPVSGQCNSKAFLDHSMPLLNALCPCFTF